MQSTAVYLMFGHGGLVKKLKVNDDDSVFNYFLA